MSKKIVELGNQVTVSLIERSGGSIIYQCNSVTFFTKKEDEEDGVYGDTHKLVGKAKGDKYEVRRIRWQEDPTLVSRSEIGAALFDAIQIGDMPRINGDASKKVTFKHERLGVLCLNPPHDDDRVITETIEIHDISAGWPSSHEEVVQAMQTFVEHEQAVGAMLDEWLKTDSSERE